MSSRKGPPVSPRHLPAASIDTNASGVAESTISLGLSRFPEPPSSIPSTPIRTNYDSVSPSRSTFSQSSLPTVSALRQVAPIRSTYEPTTSLPSNQSPSFQSSRLSQPPSAQSSRPSTAQNTASIDWHNAPTGVDVDAAEERLLPTSFITSLLQENKDIRKQRRTSYASDAFSGISEMTYPPLINQPERGSGNFVRASSSRPLPSPPQYKHLDANRSPPSAFPQSSKISNRISGDSETLHSVQGHPSLVRSASASQGLQDPNISVVTPATLYGYSGSSQISSTQDSDTIRSTEKYGYQQKLPTTYETRDELDYKNYQDDYSLVSPPTADSQKQFLKGNLQRSHSRRNSVQTTKSSSASFISGLSLRRIIPWRKVKPLPPVPLIPNISVAAQNAHRREEELTPLPDLVNRAGILQAMLDNGQTPYDSVHGPRDVPNPIGLSYDVYEAEARKQGYPQQITQVLSFHPSQSQGTDLSRNTANIRKKKYMWISFAVIVILAAIGTGVGISLGGKKKPQFNCSGSFTGAGCSLDTTCVCTSITNCNGLAQAVINIIPIVNREFNMNFTPPSVYSDIWLMQGSPITNDCTSQALLLDVGYNINQITSPNRTQWARAAMLWNAVQTQDGDLSHKMADFVRSRSWDVLTSTDGSVAHSDDSFSINIGGYTYDYAAQTVTQPPATFATLGQPSQDQLSRVSSTARFALDRMYTYAQASSIQQQAALKKYWASVLMQSPADLLTFKAAINTSPILLPFNASSSAIRDLYVNSPSSSFPPPLSCFPALSNSELQRINTFETSIFGLQSAPAAEKFASACYRDRPVYGILDVLRLRLPFPDSHPAVARQGVVLSTDAASRAVVYNTELLSSGGPDATFDQSPLTSIQLDPRIYGTLNFSDHVILQYLSSFSNATVRSALVKFILTSAMTNVPPDPSSLLIQSLPSIPVLEVAVFGDIPPSDVSSTVSAFTTPSGSLFFGSDDGSAMRNWTINTIHGPVVWTVNATSPLVARDRSLAADTTITQTWDTIALVIAHNISGIGLPNITTTLQRTNDLSP